MNKPTLFTILGLDHIVLRTNKIKEMLAFYCDTLGCVVEKTQEAIGLTQLRTGDSIIDLVEIKDALAKEGRNMDHFCLRIKPFNYDSLNEYLQKKGITILRFGTRYGAQGYGESIYLADPEGNEVELKAAVS